MFEQQEVYEIEFGHRFLDLAIGAPSPNLRLIIFFTPSSLTTTREDYGAKEPSLSHT